MSKAGVIIFLLLLILLFTALALGFFVVNFNGLNITITHDVQLTPSPEITEFLNNPNLDISGLNLSDLPKLPEMDYDTDIRRLIDEWDKKDILD